MLVKIEDFFHGYLDIDDDCYVFSVNKQKVTLLPACADENERLEYIRRLEQTPQKTSRFFWGSVDNYPVAILCNSRIHTGFLNFDAKASFYTPLIIKACGNADAFYGKLTEELDYFHAITFWGGNINSVYNPQLRIDETNYYDALSESGLTELRLKPRSDFTHEINVDFSGEKATLQYFIAVNHDPNKKDSCSLGELNSYLRLIFENAQPLERLETYYTTVKALISLLVRQRNVTFNVDISQKTAEGGIYRTGICKIFDNYENYADKKYSVISLNSVHEKLPKIIELISQKGVETFLSLLPVDNRRISMISITNVQDLCTTLEIAYSWGQRDRVKDDVVQELKTEIKKVIKEFINTHEGFNAHEETTIGSAFDHLDYMAKHKFTTLYEENQAIIDKITDKLHLSRMNGEIIQQFVKIRNNKTHTGICELDDATEYYAPLFALSYACLFKHVGFTDEETEKLVLLLFSC